MFQLENYLRRTNKRATEKRSSLYTTANGAELPKYVIHELTQFTRKRNKAIIDVYWLYDDGGLTLLLPYIISTRRNWESARLRVFALANKKDEIEVEMSSMASLLAKFRIDYSDLELLTDITKKADESTYYYFKDLIQNFTSKEKELCDNPNDCKLHPILNCVHDFSNGSFLLLLQLFLLRTVNCWPLRTKPIDICVCVNTY